ncbi:MAG: hypothetical protein N2Z67_00565 [Acetobacteraceae bacterium]|nr:hypothetical protein [Acetobacteraceae bacterium]
MLSIALGGAFSSNDQHVRARPPNGAVKQNIFDRLVHSDGNFRVVPGLVHSHEAISPTTREFRLRRDVTRHDGSPFTAADAAFTFERVAMESNPAWWGEQQPWNRAICRMIADQAGRIPVLLAGDVDASGAASTPDVERLRAFCRASGVRVPALGNICLRPDRRRDDRPGVTGPDGERLIATPDPARGRGTANRSLHSNPEFDAVLDRALSTLDVAEREALFRQAARIAMADHAIILLHRQVNMWASRSAVRVTPRNDERTMAMEMRPAAS